MHNVPSRHMHKLSLNLQGNVNLKITRLQLLKSCIPLSSGSINPMHDSIGFDRAYTLYSNPSSEQRSPSLQQPRPPLRERSAKVTLPFLAHGDDLLSSQSNSFIKSDLEKCHTFVKLQAFAGDCVQPISGIANFRISAEHNYTKAVKYYFLLLLSHLESASIMRRTVSTNLGPVSQEVNTFRVYFGSHKSRAFLKMTAIHFKSSNLTINPFLSRLKHVTRPHFNMSFLIGSVGSYYNVPRDWLRKQLID